MDEISSATQAPALPTVVFDGEPHDSNGITTIGWEVQDDYGTVIHRASWTNGKEWHDPQFADFVYTESMQAKIRTARALAIGAVSRLLLSEGQLPVKEYSLAEIELTPLEWAMERKKPVPPDQDAVASALFEAYGPRIMREVEDVFVYVGTHWKEQQPKNFRRFIRSGGQVLMSGKAKDRELDAYYNMMLDKVDRVPSGMSFYQQNPALANFLDGTLEIECAPCGAGYTLKFREHRRADLLTWVLPYRYKNHRAKNPIFREWLDKAFKGDPDAEGKIRALKQIGGACLISLFPRTAFLYGPAGTGKSTFAKLCAAFVGRDNVTGVQPSQIQQGSFMMESLIGKQVNIVTDISEARLDSAIFKQIEDRVRFQINRKNKLAIMAYIPALHIFGGNVLPRGIDGASAAMDRRISIIEFIQDIGPGTGAQIRDFEQIILGAGSGDVLQFFLDGLEDLCRSGGLYFNPESGKRKLTEWKLDNDPLGMFFEAIRSGDFEDIKLHRNASIRAGMLWEAFGEYKNSRRLWSSIGRRAFYDEVRKLGCECKEDSVHVLHCYGIGRVPGPGVMGQGSF